MGKTIAFNSWKHYLFYCVSQIHISAHVGGCVPEGSIFYRYIKKILHIKDVFIPHGVSYGIADFCLKKYAKIDLFICSGRLEYENIINNYGYDKKEVALTGFPRLDYWNKEATRFNQILLMPTWRQYLVRDENLIFENTCYYKAFKDLIESTSFVSFIEENNLKLILYLHNDMAKLNGAFHTNSENVVIVRNDAEYDIQDLLQTSSLLITDYSSVHFDFAYMNKPVIYYQFDQDEFYEKQYERSIFSAEENGYGPVVYELEELVYQIKKYFKAGYKVEDEYSRRMRAFYELYDENNCKRVYNRIVEMKG